MYRKQILKISLNAESKLNIYLTRGQTTGTHNQWIVQFYILKSKIGKKMLDKDQSVFDWQMRNI